WLGDDVAAVKGPGRDIHLDVGRVIPVHQVIMVHIAGPRLPISAALLKAVTLRLARLIGTGSVAISDVVSGEAVVIDRHPELGQAFIPDHNAAAAVVEERVVHSRDVGRLVPFVNAVSAVLERNVLRRQPVWLLEINPTHPLAGLGTILIDPVAEDLVVRRIEMDAGAAPVVAGARQKAVHLVVLDDGVRPIGFEAVRPQALGVAHHLKAINNHIASVIGPSRAVRPLNDHRAPVLAREIGYSRGWCAGGVRRDGALVPSGFNPHSVTRPRQTGCASYRRARRAARARVRVASVGSHVPRTRSSSQPGAYNDAC